MIKCVRAEQELRDATKALSRADRLVAFGRWSASLKTGETTVPDQLLRKTPDLKTMSADIANRLECPVTLGDGTTRWEETLVLR